MDKKEIKQNLIKQLSKVKTFIYASSPDLIGLPEVNLTDFDINDKRGLLNAIISVKIKIMADHDFDTFVGLLNKMKEKIYELMDKIAFDGNGKLVRPNDDSLLFSGGIMLTDVSYSFNTDDILTLEVDCMFDIY